MWPPPPPYSHMSDPLVTLYRGKVNIPPKPALTWPPPPPYSHTVKELGTLPSARACEAACVAYVANRTVKGTVISPLSSWSKCQSFTWTAPDHACVLVVDADEWAPRPAPAPAAGTVAGQLRWPPAPCAGRRDCSRNGVCNATTALCECRAAWTGDRCQTLAVLPAASPRAGLRAVDGGRNTSSWGGGVLLGDDNRTLHMWASEMLAHCGINAWTTNSHIIHATCVLPAAAPATRAARAAALARCEFKRDADEVWPRFSHEPNVVRAPSGEWVMYFTAAANRSAAAQSPLCAACNVGTTPQSCPGGAAGFGPTYMSWATSPRGPWSPPARLFDDAAQRRATNMDTNLAAVILPNGSVVGIGRTSGAPTNIVAHLVTASDWRDAASYKGRWDAMLFPNTTLMPADGVEDPFVYVDSDGVFHAVFHNQLEDDDERLCGGHAFSEDGVAWAYTGTAWSNVVRNVTAGRSSSARAASDGGGGGAYAFSRRERPHFVFSDPAHPTRITALTTGVQFGPGSPIARPGEDACFTQLQPVRGD